MKRMTFAAASVAALLLTVAALPARADTFDLTSCHLSGGCGTATDFGTVTLSQVGSNVQFDIVLNSGNNFVETGAGGGALFVFNDTLNHTVSNITATFNGATVAVTGGLSGATGLAPFQADGTGNFTAKVYCTIDSSCNGNSGIPVNDLHFTVENTTLAQLETTNANGNYFVADILCNQPGCTGKTGPVDASTPPRVPDGGVTIMLLGGALVGLETLRRRFAA